MALQAQAARRTSRCAPAERERARGRGQGGAGRDPRGGRGGGSRAVRAAASAQCRTRRNTFSLFFWGSVPHCFCVFDSAGWRAPTRRAPWAPAAWTPPSWTRCRASSRPCRTTTASWCGASSGAATSAWWTSTRWMSSATRPWCAREARPRARAELPRRPAPSPRAARRAAPQHWAVTRGNTEILEHLINAPGAKVNLPNEEDQTALMRACRLGRCEAAKVRPRGRAPGPGHVGPRHAAPQLPEETDSARRRC